VRATVGDPAKRLSGYPESLDSEIVSQSQKGWCPNLGNLTNSVPDGDSFDFDTSNPG